MKTAHLFSIIAQVLVLGAGLPSAQAAGAPSGSLIVNGSLNPTMLVPHIFGFCFVALSISLARTAQSLRLDSSSMAAM